MPERALAYFLTWTCYGTWLHGDARGSVDRRHHSFGTPFLSPDEALVRRRELALKHAPFRMSTDLRSVVGRTIGLHCERRGWTLHAANVRSNHVHVVVSAGVHTPEQAMDQLKSWSTRALRDADEKLRSRSLWTEHGSTRYLWNQTSLASAIIYVRDFQD